MACLIMLFTVAGLTMSLINASCAHVSRYVHAQRHMLVVNRFHLWLLSIVFTFQYTAGQLIIGWQRG